MQVPARFPSRIYGVAATGTGPTVEAPAAVGSILRSTLWTPGRGKSAQLRVLADEILIVSSKAPARGLAGPIRILEWISCALSAVP
jgi:hypothetical protein